LDTFGCYHDKKWPRFSFVSRPRPRAEAVLLDFDGVLRRYDPTVNAAVEARFGLPVGTVLETALQWPRLLPAVTGQVSRAEWLDGVASTLTERLGGAERAHSLVVEWDAYRGEIVPEVLAFVREVRAAGVPVGLATNATNDLHADLEALGVADDFDVVINSSEIGVHKPAREFFQAACEAVRVTPERCLFVDDQDRNVRGARAAGLSAYRYDPPDDLRYVRAALGL
jgi:putative hydrolase of the HAD superfamily